MEAEVSSAGPIVYLTMIHLQAFPVVKLRRTNIRIVHKVANTVGRVMTTGINIANKSSSSNALQSQDQPELDARYVYVGVHADGPTRVLCFGETRDEYTRGTNEESVALLTQRLKSLEERNKVYRCRRIEKLLC